ncbi:hypothetical protein [Pedobacter sp. SYP-B3415]|uniref:hypothetical protein n=1 Tax=Pedobacter sp. SYP-B3415 TaxID=2496641 RepID=UPI00101BCC95|nr:hypothetical protein [Pedobacter sp. SYP-B3415]
MKKTLLFGALLFACNLLHAQDLLTRIPARSTAVASFRAGNFFNLLSAGEFNDSFIGKAIFDKTKNDPAKPHAISDLGFNLKGEAYYFYQTTDSVSYHCIWLPIEDRSRFEKLFTADKGRTTRNGNLSKHLAADSSAVLTWNDQRVLVVTPGLQSDFFSDSTKAARYGIKVLNYQPPVMVDSVAVPEIYDGEADSVEAVSDPVVVTVPPPVKSGETTDADAAQKKADELYDTYTKAYAEQENRKKALALSWAEAEAVRLFDFKGAGISGDLSFARSSDNKAVASIWVRNLNDVLAPAFSIFGFRNPLGSRNMISGFKSLTGHLYFEKEKMRLTTAMEMDKEMANNYKRIYSRKLNKKFLRYVDSQQTLGFLSYAVNTQAYLETMPDLFKRTVPFYLFGEQTDFAELISDVFSTILDEKAVGKVIKGDALFVLNNITQREVKYKSYEYDNDDYETAPVEKTRTQPSPEFLFMFSSEDHRIFDRLLMIGERKGVLQKNGNIYQAIKGNDFADLYLLIRDGIVFAGTSPSQLEKIAQGSLRLKPSPKHRALLSKNAMSAFFGPKTISQKLATEAWMKDKTILRFQEVLKGMGDVYFQSNGVRNNIVTAELVAENGADQQNSLKYLFRLIETAAR